jgi:predicted DNA-binding transcriptional regulator AlpA
VLCQFRSLSEQTDGRPPAGSALQGSDMPSDARSSRGTVTAVTPGCGRSPPPASPDHQAIGPDVGPPPGTPPRGERDHHAIGGAPPVRLIFKRELLERVGLSFPTIWKMMQQGRFPRARVIGGKSVWIESEVDDFLAALPLRQYKGDA